LCQVAPRLEHGVWERLLALPRDSASCFGFLTQRRKGAKAQKGKKKRE
jgi:hypothetical protein